MGIDGIIAGSRKAMGEDKLAWAESNSVLANRQYAANAGVTRNGGCRNLKKASASEVFPIVRTNNGRQGLDKSGPGRRRCRRRRLLKAQRLIESLEDKPR